MKKNQKTAVILISLLIITGSATSVFQVYGRRTFTITFSSNPADTANMVVAGNAVPTVTVQNNQDQTVTIEPEEGYGLTAVEVAGTDNYEKIDGLNGEVVLTFFRVKSSITVTAFCDVSAISTSLEDSQVSELILTNTPQFLPPLNIDGGTLVTPYYQIEIIGDPVEGLITVTVLVDTTLPELVGEDQNSWRLYIGNPVDFNLDDTVNGNDVELIMEEAKKNPADQNKEIYDLNGDNKVDSYDVLIVKDYANSGLIVNPGQDNEGQFRIPWIDITTNSGWLVEDEIWKIEGETWHLSIFGIR